MRYLRCTNTACPNYMVLREISDDADLESTIDDEPNSTLICFGCGEQLEVVEGDES